MSRRSGRSSAIGLRAAVFAAAFALGGGEPAAQPQVPAGTAPGTHVIGDFAGAPPGALPPEWQPLYFPDIRSHTRYVPAPDPVLGQVVKATAIAAASGLLRKITLDARTRPLLRWRWKVDNMIAGSDMTRKDGDDYPARIYVSFAYDPARATWTERARYGAARLLYGEYPPHSGLNYIWEGRAPVGAIAPNPFTAQVKMIVVESGPEHVGQWRHYERNIFDDYRKAFGADPPPVSGVAIMTDTDNTGGSATAWYGNIELAPAAQ